MAQTDKGTEKYKATMVKKHGSLEAWRKFMQEAGRKGGKANKSVRPFAADPDLARRAGDAGNETMHGQKAN